MRVIYNTINVTKQYDINDAISTLKQLTTVKFVESVDVAINTGIDSRKSEQNIRGSVVLPHGTGRFVRVAVFTQGANTKVAEIAGADLIGMENLAEKIKKNEIDFDVVIATPDTMWLVSQLGSILGPKGLMPNPNIGTVTENISTAIKNAKSGQVRYRNDQNGIIHTIIGKINFDNYQLKENLQTLLTSLKKAKPVQAKGTYIRKISISTTMGGGIIINPSSFL